MADDRKDLALSAARRALGGDAEDGRSASVRPLQRQAEDLANRGDWGPEAEDLNRRLLQLDPQLKVAMTRLARCLRERGDAEAAEMLYTEILTLDPANVIASNFLRGLRRKRERVIAEAAEAALAAKKAAAAARKLAGPVQKAPARRNAAAALAAAGGPGSASEAGSVSVDAEAGMPTMEPQPEA